jgi:hypothetical protein
MGTVLDSLSGALPGPSGALPGRKAEQDSIWAGISGEALSKNHCR